MDPAGISALQSSLTVMQMQSYVRSKACFISRVTESQSLSMKTEIRKMFSILSRMSFFVCALFVLSVCLIFLLSEVILFVFFPAVSKGQVLFSP